MEQVADNPGRGRPKGSGFDDSERILKARVIMRDHGVSRRRALAMVDPDPATIRRLERKMAKDASDAAYRTRVGTWALNLVAENTLGADDLRTFEDLRDNGPESIDLSTVALIDSVDAMEKALSGFFRDEDSATTSLRGWLMVSDRLGAESWIEHADHLLMLARYRQFEIMGLMQEGEGNILTRMNMALRRILAEMGVPADEIDPP